MKKITIDFQGRPLSIETGRLAKQANGAVWVQYGETAMLVTAVGALEEKPGQTFFPLSVDYLEKFSAAGRIPGGFFKREGRQSEREILISRIVDRPIRPLFPEEYQNETQIIATLFSYDPDNEPAALALLGASAALHISNIPFMGPVSGVHVGRVDGQLICNPTVEQKNNGDIYITMAASKEAIVMVEAECKQVPESEVLEALKFGFEQCQVLNRIQDDLRAAVGLPKRETVKKEIPADLTSSVQSEMKSRLADIFAIKEKLARYRKISETKKEVLTKLCAEGAVFENHSGMVAKVIEEYVSENIRDRIIHQSLRLDGRNTKDIRDISIEVGFLPRTHGSAVFTRGETQALVTTTLGTGQDSQIIDSVDGESKKHFLLHYNFPPFSVGETKPLRGPARREVGHGALAHKAVEMVMPSVDEFPYTVRVISDVLESHGSSSMATVCGSTLALMDAGVPLKAPVAGIAMGLIKEDDKFAVLSDISGDEDHIGDMDFKVAGTEKGVTAVQMDIKITGLPWNIMEQALAQAKDGRMHILNKMKQAIETPRTEMSKYAPRLETMHVHQDKIREVIGSGGKVIRSIVEKSGAEVDIDDTGKITIASANLDSLNKARQMIEDIVAEAEVGKVYKGKVMRVMEYGAFVEILPGKEGLCHISEFLSSEPVEDANDVVAVGDELEVKVLSVDHQGKIKLSHREAIAPGSGGDRSEERDRGSFKKRGDSGRAKDRGRGRMGNRNRGGDDRDHRRGAGR